jgi:hypothetical protein
MITTLAYALRQVDPDRYNGWDGRPGCWGCAHDLHNLLNCAEQQGAPMSLTFPWVDKFSTRDQFRDDIRTTAQEINGLPRGHVNILFSWHGTQRPDHGGDEDDGRDEGFCFYDGIMWDDEIADLLGMFARHITVMMIVDACHSGSMHRGPVAQFIRRIFGFGRRAESAI